MNQISSSATSEYTEEIQQVIENKNAGLGTQK
jgi:hypothetical protein